MAAIDSEVVLNRGTALKNWFTRQPSAVIEISPDQPQEQVTEQVVGEFLQRRNPAAPLAYRHPMGYWKPYTTEEAVDQLQADIKVAFDLRRRMDFSSGISGIKVVTHEGLPDLKILGWCVFTPTWLFKLQIDEWTRLGQGTALFDRDSGGFNMSQSPGESSHPRRTIFRELRRF